MTNLQKNLRGALEYATNEIDHYRIDYLIREMDRCRCPATMLDGSAEYLFELMNEFAEDNSLPTDFWCDDFSDDEIVGMAYDLIHAND